MALYACMIPPETKSVQEKKESHFRKGEEADFPTYLVDFGASIILC